MGMRWATAVSAAIILGMASAAHGKTLVYCSDSSPQGFGPQLWDLGASLDAVRPVFNRLVEFETGSSQLKPGLADSWTISEDGLTYTFRLRQGVKFQSRGDFKPTRDFDADDVLFSIERMLKADHPYHQVSGGTYLYFAGMDMPDIIKSVDKLDQHTVRFTLNRAEAPFLADLAMDWASILSKEYADHLMAAGTPEKIDQEPVGTGPYLFVAYQKDAVIRYRANPDYFRGVQPVDSLIFAIVPDPAIRRAKLEAGECDVMMAPAPADIDGLRANPDVTLLESPGMNVAYLSLNVRKPPLDDKRVRQAINMAVDKDAIVRAVYLGGATPAKNPLPPVIWSYNDDVAPYAYDPAAAKKLVTEAGAEGKAIEVWFLPTARSYNPDPKRMGELIQADLKAIGLDVSLMTFDAAEYRKKVVAAEHWMAQGGWIGDNGDPDNFLYVLSCAGAAEPPPQNNAKWCNPAYDELIREAKATSDTAERTRLYREAQQIAHDEAPWLPIAHVTNVMALRKGVLNYNTGPVAVPNFEGVDKSE